MRRRDTSRRILDAAWKLLDREGARGVTMRTVARRVGITPMAIYKYFPSRDALLDRLANDEFTALAERIGRQNAAQSSRRRALALFDAYLGYALAKPYRFDLMFTARRRGAHRFSTDFRVRRSPTANLIADALAADRRGGHPLHRDVWDAALTLAALGHGLILLYSGGRMGIDEAGFRRLFRRQMKKVLDALAA
jgi:AcrR family transcriptional regulator